MRPGLLAPALVVAVLAAPAAAQAVLTLEQVERKYREMNEVHILKCDYDDDRLFRRGELVCVQSIYELMYVERD